MKAAPSLRRCQPDQVQRVEGSCPPLKRGSALPRGWPDIRGWGGKGPAGDLAVDRPIAASPNGRNWRGRMMQVIEMRRVGLMLAAALA
jgi:hypothetical protein